MQSLIFIYMLCKPVQPLARICIWANANCCCGYGKIWQCQCAANCYNVHCDECEHSENKNFYVCTNIYIYICKCVCALIYTVRHKCGHKNLSHVSDSINGNWYFSLFAVFRWFVNVFPSTKFKHSRLRIRRGVLQQCTAGSPLTGRPLCFVVYFLHAYVLFFTL